LEDIFKVYKERMINLGEVSRFQDILKETNREEKELIQKECET